MQGGFPGVEEGTRVGVTNPRPGWVTFANHPGRDAGEYDMPMHSPSWRAYPRGMPEAVRPHGHRGGGRAWCQPQGPVDPFEQNSRHVTGYGHPAGERWLEPRRGVVADATRLRSVARPATGRFDRSGAIPNTRTRLTEAERGIMAPPLGGGCLCAAIRYEISAAPLRVYACHCTDCQRVTGSAFPIGVVVSEDSFRATGNERALAPPILAESGRAKRLGICPDCSVWLFDSPRTRGPSTSTQ